MTTMISFSFRTEEALLNWFNSDPARGLEPACSLEGIVRGGSVRRFYRLLGSQGNSLGILMEYSREKIENSYYVDIASFLEGLGVPVPQTRYHDSEQGLAWVEDLGSRDLHQLKDSPWSDLKAHYVSILRAIKPLWSDGMSALETQRDLALMEGFGSRLYRWERDYFCDQCLMRFSRKINSDDRDAIHRECGVLEELLLKQSVHLIHRDFQSHNIMIRECGPGFVDFQGMRTGSWFYDLASLLYDPYMNLSAHRRDELLDVAAELMEWPGSDGELDLIFHAASVQRLMQAMGAYGFLGTDLGKSGFLNYIPVAKENLLALTSELGLSRTVAVVAGIEVKQVRPSQTP